jgi:hypothetical protein
MLTFSTRDSSAGSTSLNVLHWLYDPNNVCWKVRVMKLFGVEFLHHSATCLPVEAAYYSPRLPVFFPLIANGLLRKLVLSWKRMSYVVGNGHSIIILLKTQRYALTHRIFRTGNFRITRQLGHKHTYQKVSSAKSDAVQLVSGKQDYCHRVVGQFSTTLTGFSVLFSWVVIQMPRYNSKRQGTVRNSQFFSFCCYVCSVLCILCTVLLSTKFVVNNNNIIIINQTNDKGRERKINRKESWKK